MGTKLKKKIPNNLRKNLIKESPNSRNLVVVVIIKFGDPIFVSLSFQSMFSFLLSGKLFFLDFLSYQTASLVLPCGSHTPKESCPLSLF